MSDVLAQLTQRIQFHYDKQNYVSLKNFNILSIAYHQLYHKHKD